MFAQLCYTDQDKDEVAQFSHFIYILILFGLANFQIVVYFEQAGQDHKV